MKKLINRNRLNSKTFACVWYHMQGKITYWYKFTGGSRGQPGHGPQAQEGGPSCLLLSSKLPKVFFSKLNLGSSKKKNSGLNPWSFRFWRYPRLGTPAKLVPLKPAAGSASCVNLPHVEHSCVSLLFYLTLT